jgi:hypothetical protein
MSHYNGFVSHAPTFGFIGDAGWAGVDLFFVLSGYLIGNQLLAPARARRSLVAEDLFRAPAAAHAAELLCGAGRLPAVPAFRDRRPRMRAAVAVPQLHAERRTEVRADLHPLLVAVHRGTVLRRAAAGRAGAGALRARHATGLGACCWAPSASAWRCAPRPGWARHRMPSPPPVYYSTLVPLRRTAAGRGHRHAEEFPWRAVCTHPAPCECTAAGRAGPDGGGALYAW